LLKNSSAIWQGPNVSTTPLRQWVFWQCLLCSWTTLRGKDCRHPIAVMGVVDTFWQGIVVLGSTRESEPQEPSTGLLKQQDFGNRNKEIFSSVH